MEENMAIDPVCEMEVDEKTAAAKSSYEGKIYYFCSEECKDTFEEDPEEFISSAA
jgi:YHS domain-containing protein